MKLRGKILGVSEKCFYAVVLACTIGILLGSFFDFQINERLANVTKRIRAFRQAASRMN